MSFFSYLKNIFILLIFLQLTPPLLQSVAKQYRDLIMPKTKVGVIKLDEVLSDSSWCAKQLYRFFKDESIAAIVLKIESAGSTAGTGQALCHEIKELKKEYPKPIITLTENMCASGAYCIASATDHIIASGQAIIGSIGSYIPYLFQLEPFLQEHHIGYAQIKSGAYKGSTDPFYTLTDQDKAHLQEVTDDSYDQFVADVAHNRKLAVQDASQWAEGKLFTGKQAQQIGLVDQIGSAHSAISYIKDKKLIDHEIEWVHAQTQSGILKNIFGASDIADDNSIFSSATHGIKQIIYQCMQSCGLHTSQHAALHIR